MTLVNRRALLAGMSAALAAPAVAQTGPFRIIMVTFRGWTDSDRGFVDHLKRRRVPVEIEHIDLAGQIANGAAAVTRIRAAAPDLLYIWGTGVTLAILGRHDANPANFVRGIPTVFVNVTDPVASGVVKDLGPTGALLTGSTFLAPVEAQRAGAVGGERGSPELARIEPGGGVPAAVAERGQGVALGEPDVVARFRWRQQHLHASNVAAGCHILRFPAVPCGSLRFPAATSLQTLT
jgi:hypothetical protein